LRSAIGLQRARALRTRIDNGTMIHLAIFDLEPAVEGEFLRWYEGDHVPAVLRRPGWRRARAYRCTDGQPLVSIYDVDDDVPTEPPLSEAPFRNERFAARGIRNYHARTWRELRSAGDHQARPEWINVVTVDIEAAHAAAFDRWYNDVHVPEILACPGWLANHRYECVDGEPRFLAVYDLGDDTLPFGTAEWRSAVGWDEHVDHIRGFHGFRVYRLMFACS
jgi:hypothetical protein